MNDGGQADRIALPQLEICAETTQACLAAFEGGAQRIEVCSALSEGGVTPSDGLIRAAVAAGNGLPVYVLLRPRTGNFVYSDAEFEVICGDLEHAGSLGAAGFVTGILTVQHAVDEVRMRKLISLAGKKEVTFHRAFDHTQNLKEALERIIDTGCGRLLTSGGKPTAQAGMNTIVELHQQARNRLRVAAGGGVTRSVAVELRRMASVDLHMSLRRRSGMGNAGVEDPLWDASDRTEQISARDIHEMASLLLDSHPCPGYT